MAKEKTVYTCSECGGISPKWLGKCPHCNAWNTLEETRAEPAAGKNRMQALTRGLNAAQPVTTLSHIEAADVARTPTGLEELDRVLGVGLWLAVHHIDWIGLRAQPMVRIGAMVACLVGAAVLYFGALALSGLNLRKAIRR